MLDSCFVFNEIKEWTIPRPENLSIVDGFTLNVSFVEWHLPVGGLLQGGKENKNRRKNNDNEILIWWKGDTERR